MKNMKYKKVLSLILSAALTVGCLPAYSISSKAASDEQQTASSEQQTVVSEQQATSDEQQAVVSEQQTASDEQQAASSDKTQSDLLDQLMDKYSDSLTLMNFSTVRKLQKKEENKKIGNGKLLYTNDIFLEYRNLIDGYLTEDIQAIVSNPDNYCDEVTSEAEAIYEEARDELDAAKTITDLTDYDGSDLQIKSEYLTAITILENLIPFSKKGGSDTENPVYVYSIKDLSSIQQNIQQCLNDNAFGSKNNFNTYYWEQYSETKAEILEESKGAESFTECAILMALAQSLNEETSYEDAQVDLMHYMDGGLQAVTGILGLMIADPSSIMREDNVENYRQAVRDTLTIYSDYQLKNQVSADMLKQVKSKIDTFETKIKSIEDTRNITRSYRTFIKSLEKYTGVTYEDATTADKTKMATKMNKLDLSYDRKLYSEEGKAYLSEAVLMYGDPDSAVKKAELDYLYDQMSTEMSKVKTSKQELTAAKNKYIKKLKSYLGNKKYNQKKVKPLVSEGVKKIKAAKTINKVESIYEKYKAKIVKAKKKTTSKKKTTKK